MLLALGSGSLVQMPALHFPLPVSSVFIYKGRAAVRMGLATNKILYQEPSKCQLLFLWGRGACVLTSQFSHKRDAGLTLAVFLDGPRVGLLDWPRGLASAGAFLTSPGYLPPPHPPAHLLQDLYSLAE